MLAIAFTVVFQIVNNDFQESTWFFSDWEATSIDWEELSATLTFDQWMSTGFMWFGMALVAA